MRMSSLPSSESARFRFGEFTFDSGSHLLLRNDEPQHLSPKAQQLLMMLLQNRPRVVTREQIYDALWPETHVCETNMASIVSELRRALGDDARSGQYIRTVHGFGYAFTGNVETNGTERVPVAILLCEGGRHLLYDGENTVGRSAECNVVLTGPTVSRQHAVIIIRGNAIVLEDRGSRNGTYVRGQKITRVAIRHQDPILFGAVTASITRKISSTLPLPMNVPEPKSDPSGQFTLA